MPGRKWHPTEGASLTQREIDCLECIADGLNHAQAGQVLNASEKSVSQSLERARRKLGARNTVHALALAVRVGALRIPLDGRIVDLERRLADLEHIVSNRDSGYRRDFGSRAVSSLEKPVSNHAGGS